MAATKKTKAAVETIGGRIAKSRQAKSMSAYRLAKNLGITVSAVCCWERGRNNPTLRNLQQISTILEVPITDLIGTK